jgi:hypothetical protein
MCRVRDNADDREDAMLTKIETLAEREVVAFLAGQPSSEAIIAFHPSAEVADRMYELIDRESSGPLSDDEQRELESYLYLEHLLRMMKIEAHRRLDQRVS